MLEYLVFKIFLDEEDILGSGQFGIVFKGILHRNGETNVVAIKTVNPDVDVETFRSLLSEIKVMEFVGKHENIIQMLGAFTENIEKCT